MAVETFECYETASEPIEACEEAIALIEELDLDGQRSLVSQVGSKPASRCPYREMTADEYLVYKVLCPKSCKLSEYKRSPIPLRVLQVALHANSLGIFQELLVWDVEDVAIKDPVLIGFAGTSQYDSNRKYYILARWGEELETYSTLVKRAVAIRRQQIKDAFVDIVGKAQLGMSHVDSVSDAAILAQKESTPYMGGGMQ